jgi:hypothetical protein
VINEAIGGKKKGDNAESLCRRTQNACCLFLHATDGRRHWLPVETSSRGLCSCHDTFVFHLLVQPSTYPSGKAAKGVLSEAYQDDEAQYHHFSTKQFQLAPRRHLQPAGRPCLDCIHDCLLWLEEKERLNRCNV